MKDGSFFLKEPKKSTTEVPFKIVYWSCIPQIIFRKLIGFWLSASIQPGILFTYVTGVKNYLAYPKPFIVISTSKAVTTNLWTTKEPLYNNIDAACMLRAWYILYVSTSQDMWFIGYCVPNGVHGGGGTANDGGLMCLHLKGYFSWLTQILIFLVAFQQCHHYMRSRGRRKTIGGIFSSL